MSIMTQLSLVAVRLVVSGACKATGRKTISQPSVVDGAGRRFATASAIIANNWLSITRAS